MECMGAYIASSKNGPSRIRAKGGQAVAEGWGGSSQVGSGGSGDTEVLRH